MSAFPNIAFVLSKVTERSFYRQKDGTCRYYARGMHKPESWRNRDKYPKNGDFKIDQNEHGNYYTTEAKRDLGNFLLSI